MPIAARNVGLAPVLAFILLLAPGKGLAATRYVNAANPAPVSPYLSWANAATNIQQAVDAAMTGDTVLVTNGVYATGGRAVYGTMTNRLAINKAITVQSVNGPAVTLIVGQGVGGGTNCGDGAIRCVYVGVSALLRGFTLTNGHTQIGGHYISEGSGGGALCENSGVLSDCVLTGNSADVYGGGSFEGTLKNCVLTGNFAYAGGGSYRGTLNNCVLTGNSAEYGGGSYLGTLNNCTLTGNSAEWGGGSRSCTLNNCLVYYNAAWEAANYGDCNFSYSCTTPLPSGEGNIIDDPMLASVSHLSALSPCIGKGSATYAAGADIDGEPLQNPPCMGADQYVAGADTGPLVMAITASGTNTTAWFEMDFTAQNQGRVSLSVWDFGDGTVVSNQAFIRHVWSSPGNYLVRLTGYNKDNPDGVSATLPVRVAMQQVHYVDAGSAMPVYPYTNWATAAQTIQDAVDAVTQLGGLVLVTNGIYATGGKAVQGTMTNRVAIEKPVVVQSVNGPAVTLVVGQGAGGGTDCGDGAIRCVYVGANAVLSGFTLTNGHTRIGSDADAKGGGVWCEIGGAVSNCVLTGNSAEFCGGGACHGTLANCVLTDNSAEVDGGGAYYGTLNNCTLTGNSAQCGGGSFGCTLTNCTLTGNSASQGGGSCAGTLYNCTLTDNLAEWCGGGSSGGTLNNCVLTGNSGLQGGGAFSNTLNCCTLISNSASSNGGGASSCTLTNCIVYFNTAPEGSNYSFSGINNSCTDPLPPGPGNITGDPLFENRLAGDLRLLPGSPCIDAGNDGIVQSGSVDLDGKPRISGAHVDMGAFEYQFAISPAFAGLVCVTNTVAQGGSVSVSVPLESNPNRPSLQWYLNGATLLPGQTTSNLVLNPVKLNDAGVYSVVVSNAYGSITGAVMTLRVSFQIGKSVCSLADTNFSLAVQMEPNRAYWLEMRTNLTEGNWQVVAGLTNHTGWTTLADTNACDRQRFYRIGVK